MSKWNDDLEKLTPSELDEHIKKGTFRLALVGMSNVGKSYRSRVLSEGAHFYQYSVDNEIQKKFGFESMEAISEWLGYPGNSDYAIREKEYLQTEEECTKLVNFNTDGKNLVFDTTGSVVYLSPHVLDWLHHECLIVHLDIEEDTIEKMILKFFTEPKPVIWDGFYSQRAGEDTRSALARCYPKLLMSRLEKYRKLAHLSIPASNFYDKSAEETLQIIKSAL